MEATINLTWNEEEYPWANKPMHTSETYRRSVAEKLEEIVESREYMIRIRPNILGDAKPIIEIAQVEEEPDE